MRRGARLSFAVRWINRDTGTRGTIPQEMPYLPALETIDTWRDRNPNISMWTEARA